MYSMHRLVVLVDRPGAGSQECPLLRSSEIGRRLQSVRLDVVVQHNDGLASWVSAVATGDGLQCQNTVVGSGHLLASHDRSKIQPEANRFAYRF